MRPFIISFIISASCMHLTHLSMFDRIPAPENPLKETLPSIDAIRLISLNYETIAADYYWLRALSHFGTRESHDLGYPTLIPLLERVLKLDPYYEDAYLLAGTAVTSVTAPGHSPVDDSIRLLKPGIQYVPSSVFIPVHLGFNYYFHKQDFNKAVGYFSLALINPRCPPNIVGLTTRLVTEIDNPILGIAMIDTILETINNDGLRDSYIQKRQLLELEVELQGFQRSIDKYTSLNGSPPRKLTDLVHVGILKSIPTEDPMGGMYYIDTEGDAATTSEHKRLLLSDKAKKALNNQ